MLVAQGYVTAQDRLWQMDVYRRSANGELAEVMGPSLVRHDKAQRMFQFRNTARRIYANIPAEERARYEAYARGVNLYIAQHQDSLPPEFRLLHYKPQPWTGADSVSIGMMMVDMLDTHWHTKLARERIAAKLQNPKLESDLYPVGSWRDHPPTGELLDLSQPHPEPPPTSNDEDDERTQTLPCLLPISLHQGAPSELIALSMMGAPSMRGIFAHGWESTDFTVSNLTSVFGQRSCRDCTPGSNNWVIAGKHTASGKPLLSNDMHLGLNEPNIWYIADLRAPGFHAAGVTLPGVPFVVAGHNEHVAWGFTALYGDVQDLYIEKVQGNNYEAATRNGSHSPSNMKPSTCAAAKMSATTYASPTTDRCSIPSSPRTHAPSPSSGRSTIRRLNSIPLYALNTASNWADFSSALSQWNWPTQNVVYSDDQGHIAYHAVGKVPFGPEESPAYPSATRRTSGRATSPSMTCPTRSIRLRASSPPPTPV